MHSATEAEFIFQFDWQHNTIRDGEFTVESDRDEVAKLGVVAVESKIRHLQAHGPIDAYRFYLAHRPTLLGFAAQDWSLEEFLQHFSFASLDEALTTDSGMDGTLCALFAGDANILRLLVEHGADVSRPLRGLNKLGYYDSMSPLAVATRSNQHPVLLKAMLELRADVNARTHAGVTALCLAQSPEHVRILLEARADLQSPGLPVGITPLTAASCFANVETVAAMLAARCNVNPPMEGFGWSPLHGAALFARGNRHSPEKARMLLDHRADVNARAVTSGLFKWVCRLARAQTALSGFSACAAKTRFFASLDGITPLGMAALVGDRRLTEMFLEHGAGEMPNDRGDGPEDLANANQHFQLRSMLEVVSVTL